MHLFLFSFKTNDKRGLIELEMKIFVVEDDTIIFELLKERLEQWSFRVLGPDNFEDIMQSFLKVQPQLVILDIQLPKYDGFHWCREFRAVSKVPICLLNSILAVKALCARMGRG